jgi:glutamate mutase epsilon subunit
MTFQVLPEWVKVKVAAVAGLTGTTLPTFIDHVSPILDILIKVGQVGVAAVTIGYIYTKWRNARRKK